MEWISIKDQFPEQKQRNQSTPLLVVAGTRNYRNIYVAYLLNGHIFINGGDGFDIASNVTHWMYQEFPQKD